MLHLIKKSKISTLAVTSFLATCLIFSGVATAFTGTGAGTAGNPYQISTCAQLQEMQADLAAHYRLANNIDCSATSGWNSGAGFDPVGDDFSSPFVGSLDGNNMTISNLFIDQISTDYVGLFGWLGAGSSVADVTLANVDITGGQDVGGLAGRNYGTISNAHISGSVIADDAAGGVVSEQNGTLQDSSSSAEVTGAGETGGLAGYSEGPIVRSYATGNVTSTGDSTGGLVGYQYELEIVDSYATGAVNGTWGVGGLVGYSEIGQITRSYSTGAVTASSDPNSAGGLLGPSDTPTITDSFWDTQTSGQATSNGGTGKTTAEMKTISTFSDGNFDIQTTTTNRNNGYPFLSWEVGDTAPVWYIWDGTVSPATDGDGISNAVEDAAPNSGDGNNDGTPDKDQATVTSLVDSVTNKYAILDTAGCTANNNVSIAAEDASHTDTSYSYPGGLMEFTLTCTPGSTATITMYYYGLPSTNVILRKYNPTTHTYTTVTGATVSSVTIGGQQATKIIYQVTDGSSLDADGTANGTIVDPAGPAVLAVSAPNTGILRASSLPAFMSIAFGLSLAIWTRRRTVRNGN